MAFKAVTDLNADTTISLGGTNKKTGKKNPASIEGYYLGKKEVPDNKKKSGVSFIYILQTPQGNTGVWGKTDMDRKMTQVTPGAMVRIAHTSMVKTPNGDMYKYTVEQDLDNTVEVAAPAANTRLGAVAAYTYEDAEDDNSYSSAPSFADDDIDADLAPEPLVASPSNSARVQALLAKNKRK